MSAEFERGFSVRENMWHDPNGLWTKNRNPQSKEEVIEWTFGDNGLWEPTYSGVLVTTEGHRCQSKKDECRNPATFRVFIFDDEPSYACAIHAEVARAKGFRTEAMDTQTLEGWQAIMRSDNGHVLTVSKTSLEVFYNEETIELLITLLDETENHDDLQIEVETGLVLKDGGLVVFCARLNHEYRVNGDSSSIYPYSSIHNYHNGEGALRVQNTSVREVCANTVKAAEVEADRTGRSFSFRHTKNIREYLEDAKAALRQGRTETEEWVQYANELVAIPLNDEQFDTFLVDFVPMPPKATDRAARNVEEAREAIRNFYHSPSTVAVAGTAYGAVCAAVEYLDHGRAWRSKETYVSRSMLKPEYGKTQAMRLIEEIVGVEHEDIMAKITA